jgi:hypothetical protein
MAAKPTKATKSAKTTAKAIKLTQFLAKLATEEREFASFSEDPDAYMDAAGLSEKHQKIIKSRNVKRITEALLEEQEGPVYVLGGGVLVGGS